VKPFTGASAHYHRICVVLVMVSCKMGQLVLKYFCKAYFANFLCYCCQLLYSSSHNNRLYITFALLFTFYMFLSSDVMIIMYQTIYIYMSLTENKLFSMSQQVFLPNMFWLILIECLNNFWETSFNPWKKVKSRTV